MPDGEVVRLLDHRRHWLCPATTFDLPRAVLGSSQAFRPDAKACPFAQKVAEELAFPDRATALFRLTRNLSPPSGKAVTEALQISFRPIIPAMESA